VFGSRARQLRARVADLEAAAGGDGPASRVAASNGTDPWSFFYTSAVTRSAAMAVPTLSYIRAQLAGGVASMDLERYRKDPTGGDDDVEIDPGWCENPDPAPAIPTSVFWSWVIDDLFFNGKSTLVVLARDSTGFPVAFRRVMPGELVYQPEAMAWGFVPYVQVFYMGQEIPGEDVIVINGAHEGICNYGGQVITAALALETGAATAAAEPLPNVDLHQTAGEPLSVAAAQELVANWKAARQIGATAYTPQNLEARTLGHSPADQQQIEARQYMATQLARLAGVNPVLVSAAMGSSSSYVYTNQADYRGAFLDDVLDAYLRAIEGRLSANDVTPRGQYVQFNRDEFTRISMLERVQIMVGALKAGAEPAMIDALAEQLDLDFRMPDLPPAPPPTVVLPPPAPAPVTPPRPAPTAPTPTPTGAP
jgi:phage portal protein BeeE